jgi:hypothetical protein
MAFLSKLAHQRKKKESIARLRPRQHAIKAEREKGDQETSPEGLMQALTVQRKCALPGYLGQGYVDPFDTSSIAMADSMNMYFHHCMVIFSPNRWPMLKHFYSPRIYSANSNPLRWRSGGHYVGTEVSCTASASLYWAFPGSGKHGGAGIYSWNCLIRHLNLIPTCDSISYQSYYIPESASATTCHGNSGINYILRLYCEALRGM